MDLGKGTATIVCINTSVEVVIFHSRSWGVCFTYGTWFGLEALACMNRRYDLGFVLIALC